MGLKFPVQNETVISLPFKITPFIFINPLKPKIHYIMCLLLDCKTSMNILL